jgi:hypothetical protein
MRFREALSTPGPILVGPGPGGGGGPAVLLAPGADTRAGGSRSRCTAGVLILLLTGAASTLYTTDSSSLPPGCARSPLWNHIADLLLIAGDVHAWVVRCLTLGSSGGRTLAGRLLGPSRRAGIPPFKIRWLDAARSGSRPLHLPRHGVPRRSWPSAFRSGARSGRVGWAWLFAGGLAYTVGCSESSRWSVPNPRPWFGRPRVLAPSWVLAR